MIHKYRYKGPMEKGTTRRREEKKRNGRKEVREDPDDSRLRGTETKKKYQGKEMTKWRRRKGCKREREDKGNGRKEEMILPLCW